MGRTRDEVFEEEDRPRRRRNEDEDAAPRKRRRDEEEDEDRPRKPRRIEEEDEDRPRKPRRDEEEDRPRKPRRDEDEDRPRKPRRIEEEDEDRPRKPRRDEEEDEDRSRKPRRSHRDDEEAEEDEDRRKSRRKKRKGGRTDVYVHYSEADRLPRVCACCGRKAVTTHKKTFRPSTWGSDLLWACFGFTTIRWGGPKLEVSLPFCKAHKHYFLWRILLIVGGLVPFAIAGVLGAFNEQRMRQAESDPVLLLLPFLLIGWIILWIVVHFRSIRAKSVDRAGLTLTNVSPDFADAVNERGHQR